MSGSTYLFATVHRSSASRVTANRPCALAAATAVSRVFYPYLTSLVSFAHTHTHTL